MPQFLAYLIQGVQASGPVGFYGKIEGGFVAKETAVYDFFLPQFEMLLGGLGISTQTPLTSNFHP